MSNFIPRTWRICDNDDLNWYYRDVCQQALNDGLIDHIPTLYLFKSTATWGKCKWSRGMVVIGLNEVFCADPEKAINTIIHEVGHAATTGHHHDSYWKSVSDKLGKSYGQTVKRCTSEAEKGISLNKPAPQYKYIVECPRCHNQWKYQKMTKCVSHPETYRCGACKTSLIRVK